MSRVEINLYVDPCPVCGSKSSHVQICSDVTYNLPDGTKDYIQRGYRLICDKCEYRTLARKSLTQMAEDWDNKKVYYPGDVDEPDETGGTDL